MKRINLFIIAVLVAFVWACNPMEDINKQIDEIQEKNYVKDTFMYHRITAPAAYTLTDDDYKLSSDKSIAKYKNFSDKLLPKDYLPEILNKKFSANDGAEMLVTYNFYSKPAVDSSGARTIADAEYKEMGQKYTNFGDENTAQVLIAGFLNRTIVGKDKAEKTVKYNLFKKNLNRYFTVNEDSTVTLLDKKPKNFHQLDSADYKDLGEGKYKSFSDVAKAEKKLKELVTLRKPTLPQSYECKVYKNYVDSYVVFVFEANAWKAKQSLMPVTEPLNFSLNKNDITKSYWWADPAIKIIFTAQDYAVHPATAKYKNYDLRSGKTPGDDNAKLIEMLGEVLDKNYAPIQEKQQYLVTFTYYDGGSGSKSVRLIKEGTWKEYKK